MKELDQSTTEFVRHLERSEPQIARQYRALSVIVVWVGGDKKKLAQWAAKNRISRVWLGVIARNATNLPRWKIHPKASRTTVLMQRTIPAARYTNLTADGFDDIEDDFYTHFKRIRRR